MLPTTVMSSVNDERRGKRGSCENDDQPTTCRLAYSFLNLEQVRWYCLGSMER